MATHNDLGKDGERRAIEFLREKGYEILETNWRHQKAEIDIIARAGDTLFGLPQDFVNPKKIKMLVGAIDYYCRTIGFDGQIRFDIVAVVSHPEWKLEHFKDAFYHF
jgi:putative endonuclease